MARNILVLFEAAMNVIQLEPDMVNKALDVTFGTGRKTIVITRHPNH